MALIRMGMENIDNERNNEAYLPSLTMTSASPIFELATTIVTESDEENSGIFTLSLTAMAAWSGQ